MSTTLTNEEKMGIAAQHKRNLEYSLYNLELSLIEENAVTSPNTEVVSSLNSQISELSKKLTAINTEIAGLTE
jgi:hypothetical protein